MLHLFSVDIQPSSILKLAYEWGSVSFLILSIPKWYYKPTVLFRWARLHVFALFHSSTIWKSDCQEMFCKSAAWYRVIIACLPIRRLSLHVDLTGEDLTVLYLNLDEDYQWCRAAYHLRFNTEEQEYNIESYVKYIRAGLLELIF